MKQRVFTGSGVAIITPFAENGSVDLPCYAALLEAQLAGGSDAVVVCGTTGEASTLSDDERARLIAFTVRQVAGRVPVIAGCGSNDTAHAAELSKTAAALGADALLLVTPYYNKCSQSGLLRHFFTLAEATPLPVILYNVPARTGVSIAPATYQALSEHPRIVATKEASGDLSQLARTVGLCGEALGVYAGNDDQIVSVLALGGLGVISVAANVDPALISRMCRLYFEGALAQSRRLQLEALPLIDALFSDINPIPVKEALALLGRCRPECRLPLTRLDAAKLQSLAEALTQAGLAPRGETL